MMTQKRTPIQVIDPPIQIDLLIEIYFFILKSVFRSFDFKKNSPLIEKNKILVTPIKSILKIIKK